MIVSSRSHTNTRSKSDSGPGDGSGRRPACFFALLDSVMKFIQTVHNSDIKMKTFHLI